MLLKLFICVVCVSFSASIKNPCRRNSPTEFFPHPNSEKSYIQCSNRGEMFIRECKGDSKWLDDKKKCGDKVNSSQVQTLAAQFKISKLLARKPIEVEEPTRITMPLDKPDLKSNQTDNERELSEISKLQEQILEKQKLLEDLESEKLNLQTQLEENSQTQKESNEDGKNQQQIVEQEDSAKQSNLYDAYYKKQPTNISKIQLPNLTESNLPTKQRLPSQLEQQQLDRQTHQLNQMQIKQKFLEAHKLKQQLRLNDIMIKNNESLRQKTLQKQIDNQNNDLRKQIQQQDMIINQYKKKTDQYEAHRIHKLREKQIIEQQLKLRMQMEMQRKMDASKTAQKMLQQRKNKEMEMCKKASCPPKYRCALVEDDTLRCLPL